MANPLNAQTTDSGELACSESHYIGSSYGRRKVVRAKYVPIKTGVAAGGGLGSPNQLKIEAGIKDGSITDVGITSERTLVKLGEPVCGTHLGRARHSVDRNLRTAFEIGKDSITLAAAVERIEAEEKALRESRAQTRREYDELLNELDSARYAVVPMKDGEAGSIAAWRVIDDDQRTRGKVRVHDVQGHLRVVVVDAQHADQGNLNWIDALQNALSLASDYVRQTMDKE